MGALFVSFSFALALTAFFAFRWRVWKRPGLLAGYFALFFVVECWAESTLLPPGALGVEVAYVCLGLTGVLVAAMLVAARFGGESGR